MTSNQEHYDKAEKTSTAVALIENGHTRTAGKMEVLDVCGEVLKHLDGVGVEERYIFKKKITGIGDAPEKQANSQNI